MAPYLGLQRGSDPIAVCNNSSVKNLNEGLTVIVGFKIRHRIYKDIQRDPIHEGCIVVACMVSGNHQGIEVAVQIIGSVGIGTVKDHRKRVVFVLYVMDDLFQGNHLPNSYLSVYRIIERRQKQEPTQRESLLRRLNVKDL